jgi:Mn2+/Fe2+ NRAMP family transporter
MGPGLILMVGDNDAGGVATYAQAGQNYGLTLLCTLRGYLAVAVLMLAVKAIEVGIGH